MPSLWLRTISLSLWLSCAGALAQATPPEPTPGAPSAAVLPPLAEVAPAGEPAPPVQAEYREIVVRAIAEFDAGRFAEARALFLRAHELWPSARTFRTLGMTAFELRLYPRALVELQAALADPRRPLDAEQTKQVASLVEQTRAFVGRYSLQLSPPAAELMVDGAPFALEGGSILVLAVGDHELRVRAPGFGELRRAPVVQGREEVALALVLVPFERAAPIASSMAPPLAPIASTHVDQAPPARDLRRPLALAAFGVAAAGVVVTAVMGGLALQRWKIVKDDDNCPDEICPPPYHDERDQLERFGNTATATTVITGVALAAAAGSGSHTRERVAKQPAWSRARSGSPEGSRGLSGRAALPVGAASVRGLQAQCRSSWGMVASSLLDAGANGRTATLPRAASMDVPRL